MSPAGELGLETYVSKPLDGVVHFVGEGVRLLKEGYLVGGVSADRLGLGDGDRMEVIEVDGGVIFEPPADKGITRPLDLNEVGDSRYAVFSCDF